MIHGPAHESMNDGPGNEAYVRMREALANVIEEERRGR